MSMLKRIMGVGMLTIVSRILGFCRDILIARYLGAGMAADAFFIAFKLPNFFRRLFAEGAFSAGFIPLFARRLGSDSEASAKAFAEETLSVFLPFLIGFFALMQLIMPAVIMAMTGGFDGDTTKYQLSLDLTRITFGYLPLISLMVFFAGCLNGLDRYAAAAAAPILLNICMITALLVAGPEGSVTAAWWLASGVTIAGAAQLFWLAIALRRAGMALEWRWPRITDGTRELVRVIIPAAIGAGVIQINLLVDLFLAARFLPEGSVSWLFYADRLNQLPIGVIGVAVATVLLPTISRSLGRDDQQAASNAMDQALGFALALTIPAATALVLVPDALIAGLFERAAFTSDDTKMAAMALAFYALGLPAYIIGKILTTAWHARKNTKRPVYYAMIAVGIAVVLNLLLIGPLGHAGLALATAIAAWCNIIMLYIGLHRAGHYTATNTLIIRIIKITLASMMMGVVLVTVRGYLGDAFSGTAMQQVTAIAIMVGAAKAVYIIAALIIGAIKPSEIRSLRSSVS